MEKRVPLRQCTGCREMKPKKELVRVVKSPEDEISLDFHGKAPGRGAYLCPKLSCYERSVKAKAFNRAFKGPVGQEVLEQLRNSFLEQTEDA